MEQKDTTMSHEIYKKKFVTLRQPAWHGLGTVLQTPMGAIEASQLIALPEIRTEAVVGLQSAIPTDYKAIIGMEKGKDNEVVETVYSVVSTHYHEISHQRFLETWDKATQAKVETLGLLYDGSTMFVTTKLPNFTVKGDEIAPYLMALNPLRAGKSAKIRKTPVRVVCHNTLEASGKNFLAEWSVIHTQDAAIQLEQFLRDAYEQAAFEYEAVKDAFDLLASTPLEDTQAEAIFEGVYPNIPMQKKTMAKNIHEDTGALKELATWERENGLQIVHRTKSFELYAGEGLGSLSEAAAGTAWGAYNAVVEYEQYLKRYSRGDSFLFGAGAERVERAYELTMGAAQSA